MPTKKLTPEELLTLAVDEIIKRVAVEEITNEDIQMAKAGLKGFFKEKEAIKAGTDVKIGVYDLEISRVANTTGRVFFHFKDSPKRFSLTFDHLLGVKEEFPFAKGDQVFFNEDIICTVVGTNKASRAVIIDIEGERKKVSITRVRKFYEDEA